MMSSRVRIPDESDDEDSSIPSGNRVSRTSMMYRMYHMVEKIDDSYDEYVDRLLVCGLETRTSRATRSRRLDPGMRCDSNA